MKNKEGYEIGEDKLIRFITKAMATAHYRGEHKKDLNIETLTALFKLLYSSNRINLDSYREKLHKTILEIIQLIKKS